jgi:N-ethylmaleimide reductase
MPTHSLFDPISLGGLELHHRIVMAPMTRSRCTPDHVPTDIMVEYYKQRATAGLIITEGTSPSPNGDGYPRTPGIYTPEQCAAWKKITQGIHEAGGKVFLQLMHVGRIAHPLNKAADAETIAPSANRALVNMFTDQEGLKDTVMPREILTKEIPQIIDEYKKATQRAFECGFDGVELHAANGYLPMQFLSSNTNRRTDQYGGSLENRLRFVIEVLKAMISVAGANKIGIRISPGGEFNDIHDSNPLETYTALLQAINPLQLVYLHSVRAPDPALDVFTLVRTHFKGLSIINGGFTFGTGEAAVAAGLADMVAYGTSYLANPDLPERFKQSASLNPPDPRTFYTPGPEGYLDYPFLVI